MAANALTYNSLIEPGDADDGVVDADLQADASDITVINGGTRLAIVAPAAIATSVNPATASPLAFIHWLLDKFYRAQDAYTDQADADDIRDISRKVLAYTAGTGSSAEQRIKVVYTVSFELEYDDVRGNLQANVINRYPAVP